MYVICMYVHPSFLLAYVKRTRTDVLSCATLCNVITMLSVTLFKVISRVLLNKAILSRLLNSGYLLLRGLCVVGKLGRGKKESARGTMGRGEIRGSCRLSLFPSSTTRSLFLSIIAIFIGISIGSLCAEERNSSMRNRKEKCDASKIKICGNMGLVGIVRKNKMKNVHLLEISPLQQIGGKIYKHLHALMSDDPIKILLKLA